MGHLRLAPEVTRWTFGLGKGSFVLQHKHFLVLRRAFKHSVFFWPCVLPGISPLPLMQEYIY